MVLDYFVSNFPLLCVIIVMVIIATQNFKTRRKVSVCFLTIIGLTFVLSVLVTLEAYAKQDPSRLMLATTVTALGYIIRPFCLYCFLILAEKNLTNRRYWIYMVPALLNALIYLPSLIVSVPFFQHLTFYYEAVDGLLVFRRGYLNFFAHIISIVYLVYLIFRSVKGLRGKHRADSYPILICSAFIVGAVLLEMSSTITGVLNNTIAISCVFDYLFLLDQANRRDALTGLFDRKTYYADLDRFGRSIVGVIELDMNGLKFINDNLGHEAGDEALRNLALVFEECASKRQYVYRVGGDEFTILQSGGTAFDLESTATKIKERLVGTNLHCSCGYLFDTQLGAEELIKNAEVKMYADKHAFYEANPQFERRKG